MTASSGWFASPAAHTERRVEVLTEIPDRIRRQAPLQHGWHKGITTGCMKVTFVFFLFVLKMQKTGVFISICCCLFCVINTLVSGVCVDGEGEGDAWLTELWEGLDLLWLLLFWSSSRSGTGDGLAWPDGSALLAGSAFAAVALDVSMTTEGGAKRSEPAFRFWPSPSEAATQTSLSPGSTFPFAEWMLSMSPRMHSGW